MGRHEAGARNRLFIDEVQLCEGFEKAINSIHARGGWDVYLTGSNAFLLSSDLATLFTGRHREVHILPFGFGEYRCYFGGQGAVDDDFDGFVRRGGLAGSYDYDDVAGSYGYIRDVYRTILTRDLVQKSSLPDSAVLERLAEYVMDNSGNLDSPNSIADVLDANRVPTNHVAVGRHLSHLRDAFVFYEARRYDIGGEVPEHAGEALRLRLGSALCGPGGARHGLGPHVRERGLPGADEARLRDLRREAAPEGGRLRREEGVGARLHTGGRRRQRRFDAREGARAASVDQGRVPEGPHRPHET